MEGNYDKELAELEDELEAESKEEENKHKRDLQKEMLKDGDLYPKIVEEKYHNVEKLTSLGVLEKEIEFCNEIIRYKKKISADFDDWKRKKKLMSKKIDTITSLVEKKTWNVNTYKAKIQEEKLWEENNLVLVEKDFSLSEKQKEIIRERINNRKNIIEEELKQAVEEEKEIVIGEENIDLYSNIIEEKYHNVDKMTSLGVLEKEKELCDTIIKNKGKKGEGYDNWEKKKKLIDNKIAYITKNVSDGIWDFEQYKSKIKEQLAWEENNDNLVEQDLNLTDEQKQIIKDRIHNRKIIIEKEINHNIEESE
jgi:hypothetical protein